MQAYRVTVDGVLDATIYRATQEKAHEVAKHKTPRSDTRVELVEFEPSKGLIVDLFNNAVLIDRDERMRVLRTWAVTDRGGLREVPNGE